MPFEIDVTREAESDLDAIRPFYRNQILDGDDDTADDLIAQHPAFQETIRRARQQKEEGQVRRLADLRQEYDTKETSQ